MQYYDGRYLTGGSGAENGLGRDGLAQDVDGLAKPQHMFKQLTGAMKALLQETGLFVIIDEAGLLSCFKREAISELRGLARVEKRPTLARSAGADSAPAEFVWKILHKILHT